MQFFVVISVFIYLSQANAECPARDELHCEMYDTTNCQAGTKAGKTYINDNGNNCDACEICLPEPAQDGCPVVQCPYESIRTWYPMDCGIYNYPQIAWIGGKSCAACETFTIDCSNIDW